jgi:hypothetical protein
MEGLLNEFVKQGLQVIAAFGVMSLLSVIVFAMLATWPDDPIVIEPWESDDDEEDSRELQRSTSGDPVADYYYSGAYVGEAKEDGRP